MPAPARVEATGETLNWIARLKAKHGPLAFYQSAGCCEGSAPLCFTAKELRVGPHDVLLGEIGGCPFYIRANQFEYWRHTQLIIDVVKGGGEGFSLEGPEGISFLTRSRVFTDEEVGELAAQGEPPRAA
ncbi:DUF779 domain-containing protein [Rhodoblastus acidophilus]|uniref:DUF779 domain-containing protein n=1 Tax=Candidatus Rhodoblastus alkanivorans TaxID=2954117 RepID=A0ABS9Z4T5_9HYPH|nr:DUF779 domain-containing protein [Candidatus Rhodoblastus alkanivorans]MCI4677578.1 DUF779 domain-containing protein [Candidatus Rhodoblastus alkanivorans]MCI4682690.1 DUF779 domain-containing protein [Candidatus Rhodoblastus alkanivorans]MDI4639997.1 DUF779 domain-containing protein [Rhodoblastus acidophilus]